MSQPDRKAPDSFMSHGMVGRGSQLYALTKRKWEGLLTRLNGKTRAPTKSNKIKHS